jgi:glutathione S-transferase
MPFESHPNIVRWLEGLKRIPAWAHPWPAVEGVMASSAAG